MDANGICPADGKHHKHEAACHDLPGKHKFLPAFHWNLHQNPDKEAMHNNGGHAKPAVVVATLTVMVTRKKAVSKAVVACLIII